MNHSFIDPKKTVVTLCIVILVICTGLLVYAVISNAPVAAFAVLGFFIVGGALVLFAAHNRRTELHDDDFICRTWLGNEYRFMYRDVIWYHLAEHEVWAYTRDKRIVVDTDSENGVDFAKKLAAFGVPDKKPGSGVGVTDEAGEEARGVLYLEQRKTVFWAMLIMALVIFCLGVFVMIYASLNGDPAEESTLFLVLWPLGILAFTLYLFYTALFSLNVRVELYKEHFIYRSAFCRRKSYSYRDCISRREKRYPNTKERYKAHIKMKDGSKIIVDERIIKEGFGAAILYYKLPSG